MAQLREREVPQARVYAYIKDPPYSGTSKTRRLVELLGFRTVSSNISRVGGGSATVIFPNYKSCLIRYISAKSIAKAETKNNGQETTNSYAKTFMSKISSEDQTGLLFKGLWNDVTLSDGESGQVMLDASADFRKLGRSRGDLANGEDRNVMSQIYKEGYIAALPFISWLDPIFVDYQGQDGLWYAGFTGMVSRVVESYAKTGDQSITINCRDMGILLDNVSIVSGWNRMSVAEQNSSLNDFVYASEANLDSAKQGAFTNIFQGFKSVTDIISEVIKRAQDMWRLENNGVRLFGSNVGVRAFSFDTKIYPYNGISGRRGSIQRDLAEDPENMAAADFLTYADDELTTKHYLCDDTLPTLPGGVVRGSKKILVDPLIMKFDQKFIHKLLNNTLALYKDSLVSADQILNDLVAKMYAYKYFDGNGNLIIELARPNAFPNLKDYGGRSSSTVIKHGIPAKEEVKKTNSAASPITAPVLDGDTRKAFADRHHITTAQLYDFNGGETNTAIFTVSKDKKGNKIVFLKRGVSPIIGTEPESTGALSDIKNTNVFPVNTQFFTPDRRNPAADYLDVLSWTTLAFHGKNYVLSPDDFNSFTNTLDEAQLTTVVATDAVFPLLEKVSDTLTNASMSLHGVAVADFDKLAKLGVRRYQVQTLYNVIWPSPEAGSRVLSYQSAAVLERINAMADTGSMMLNHRPDFQVGRTIINPLRMKSHIIDGVANSWTPGGSHTTTLTLAYGHPIHKTLEVPWLAIFNEPELFFGPEGINVLEIIQAVDAGGNSVTDEPEPTYSAPNDAVEPGNTTKPSGTPP